jgi:RHS repeat-associated protein
MNLKNLLLQVLVATLSLLGASEALAARTTTYYHNDGLGSVVAATNESGQVLWRKDYAPFGEQIDTTPDTERQSYTGKSHDDATGLTYFGGRYYDPQVARFMSVDPVAFVDDNTMSFNRYLYVNNNPYKYVDPDGEFLNFVAKFVLDVGINVAVNYITTGELNVGGALKESALGLVNPAKFMASAGKLAMVMKKADKVAPGSSGFAAKAARGGAADANRAASRAKGIPDSKLGPSGKPKILVSKHATRKRAEDAAQDRSRRGKAPEEHSNPTTGDPHFHPSGSNSREHHTYPGKGFPKNEKY